VALWTLVFYCVSRNYEVGDNNSIALVVVLSFLVSICIYVFNYFNYCGLFVMNLIYEHLSDYGSRILFPLVLFLSGIAVFSWYVMGQKPCDIQCYQWSDAIKFSISKAIPFESSPPPIALTSSNGSAIHDGCPEMSCQGSTESESQILIHKALTKAKLEGDMWLSILFFKIYSILMLFLAGLGVRNHFRLKA
jgi:hypothetical protein